MDLIKTKKDDNGVFTIILDRPQIHNAFNDELIKQMTDVFKSIEEDPEVRLVVLTGAGKSFCAGADLNWMKSMINYSKAENIEDSRHLYRMFKSINNCSKPVIGKVNGHALGGGVGLVAVCDYVLAIENAKFGFTEARLGLVPAVISPFCLAKIGQSHARAWFLSGEMFKAQKALSMGLIHEVCSAEDFETCYKKVEDSFLKAGPKAAIKAKDLIRTVLQISPDTMEEFTCRQIAARRVSNEGQEGMAALLEKRKAEWVKND